jgi:ABC-type branched-subunit amino acid transport system substrate-binding protein
MLITLFLLGGRIYSPPVYLILPDSGDLKILSEEFLKGFSFAIKDEFDFLVIDEDPDTNIEFSKIYENVINKNPKIIIGPILTKNQRISAEISMRNKVIQILPITYDVSLGTYGNYVYPFNFKIYMGLQKFIEFLKENGDTNFVLFYENTINGISIKKFLDSYYPVPTIPIKNGKISKLEASKIVNDIKGYNSILFSDNGLNSINLYLALRSLGYKKNVYVFDNWLKEDVLNKIIGMTEKLYAITLQSITYSSYLLKLDRKFKFIEDYKKFYNSEPSMASMIGYDTGFLVKLALKSNDIKGFLLKFGILNGISDDYLISKNSSYIKILKLTDKGFEEVK